MARTSNISSYQNRSQGESFLPFEDFLLLLKQKGFIIGVDTQLEIQLLLNRLEEACDKERLKRLLCPILAKNKEEQRLFYELFEEYFGKIQLRVTNFDIQDDIQEIKPSHQKNKGFFEKSFYPILIVVAIIAAINLMYFFFSASSTPQSIENPPIEQPSPPSTPSEGENILTISIIIGILLLLLALGLVAFIYYRKTKKNKNKLYLQSEINNGQLLYWNIKIPEIQQNFFHTTSFYKATRLLRSRKLNDIPILDIEKTILASIKNHDYPDLQYKFGSKPPEYLILIDRNSYRDHQAELFEELTQELKKQELYTQRFFYEKQPSICWDEENRGYTITELQKKYADYYVIILGDPRELLDGLEGQLSPDLVDWSHWKQKAILSPIEPTQWMREALEAENRFILLKASVKNLALLGEIFLAPSDIAPQIFTRRQEKQDIVSWSFLKPEQSVEQLQQELHTTTFEWLCCCAVYPELDWHLTTYIGAHLFEKGTFGEKEILDLVHLPWFRQGYFPDDLRRALLKKLSKARLKEVRQLILDLLKNSPIEAGIETDEVLDRGLYIALEEAMLAPLDEQKRQILQEQAEKMKARNSPLRHIVMQYLNDKAEQKKAFELPNWVKEIFGGVKRKRISIKLNSKKKEEDTAQKEEKSIRLHPTTKRAEVPKKRSISFTSEEQQNPEERESPLLHLLKQCEGLINNNHTGDALKILTTSSEIMNDAKRRKTLTLISSEFSSLINQRLQDKMSKAVFDKEKVTLKAKLIELIQEIREIEFESINNQDSPLKKKISIHLEKHSFYSKKDILDLFKEAERAKLMLKNEVIQDALLIFQTTKQQTWLISSNFHLYCLLDDEQTRKKGNMMQWRMRHGEALAFIEAQPYKEKTGLLHIGNRRNWLYSKALFPSMEGIEIAVKQLIEANSSNYKASLKIHSSKKRNVDRLKVQELYILWVDDEPSNNRAEVEVLQEKEVQIDFAFSTEEALEMFQEHDYNWIISDMGRMEQGEYNPTAGLELAKAIRKLDVEVFFVIYSTVEVNMVLRPKLIEAGVTSMLSSPYDLFRMLNLN